MKGESFSLPRKGRQSIIKKLSKFHRYLRIYQDKIFEGRLHDFWVCLVSEESDGFILTSFASMEYLFGCPIE